MADKPYPIPWLEEDTTVIVEEMLNDPTSKRWSECLDFVRERVRIQARNIPQDVREDIVQDVMVQITRSLHTFQHNCSLTTWIFLIVKSRVIDKYREITRITKISVLSTDFLKSNEENEHSSPLILHVSRTAEEVFMIRESIRQIVAAIQEYLSTHANAERNRKILHMVLDEGHTLKEAAIAAGCSAAVAGYVVRSAQMYIRKKLRE
ncbi:MAG TPA: hypothetical protein DHW02_22750 [Ktedonobacter sp.]|nr:hypothetical protein [Ktedonobacter sp.]